LAGKFVEEFIHDLLAEPKICVLDAIKGVRKIEKMALRGPAQNAQRARDFKSLSTRGGDSDPEPSPPWVSA